MVSPLAGDGKAIGQGPCVAILIDLTGWLGRSALRKGEPASYLHLNDPEPILPDLLIPRRRNPTFKKG